jgi:glycosyltransferase involved in cell wall biosynthesis
MKVEGLKKIVIINNSSWGLYNFRSGIINAFLLKGYEVFTIAPRDSYTSKIIELGCQHYNINVDSKSKNPLKDLIYCYELKKVLKVISPDIVLSFTAKPNIYGAIVANWLKLPTISNIAGLGIGFTKNTIMTNLLVVLYKISQSRVSHVFFQNRDDRNLFLEKEIIENTSYSILPGSGVDLEKFRYSDPISKNGKVTFLLFARMLYSKGVTILIEASRKLYQEGIYNFQINLVGDLGINSTDAITNSVMNELTKESYVNYLGGTDNVIPFIQECDCVILPSFYREGTPRGLLESLAIGRPIITTDMPGCKNTVNNGLNGYLVKPKDKNDLACKMKSFLNLSLEERKKLGLRSRELAEEKFDEQFVIDAYLDKIESIIA